MSAIAFDILARDRASNTFDKVGDSADRSSGRLKKWALIGAAAVGAGAVMAGKAMIGMAQAAVEDEKSQAALARTLQNTTGATKTQIGAVEDWISKQGVAKGVADDELRPALARLALVTGDVGKAQKLTSLAMDVSAGTGKSLKTVTEALQKAQNGSLGGLSRLGVATKDAAGEEKSLAQVTKELADLHGGQAAAAAGTAEGKMARLRLIYDETKESIGAKLIPVLEQGATKTLAFVRQMENGEGAGGKLVAVLTGVKDNLGTIAPALGVVVSGLTAYKVATLAAAAATAIQTAGTAGATGATWSLNAALRANPIGIVITALTALGVGFVVAYKKSETFRSVVTTALDGVKKGFDLLAKAGVWLWNNALQPTFKFIVSGVASILDMWSSMLSVLGKVPGFGWAKDAAEAMGKAADKAEAMAAGIKKIPNKTVTVTVAYRYVGRKGGVGGTRSSDGDDSPDSYLPRMAQTAKPMAQRVMEAIADGLDAGGKKVDKVLKSGRDKIRESLGAIRDEMASMSQTVASAINQTDFGGGIAELMASLTGNGSALAGLEAVWERLRGSVSKNFLSALMQSGNVGLATALGNDPAAAAAASASFDANAAAAGRIGDKTAQAVLGDRIEAALEQHIGKLIQALKDDVPDKQAKKIRKELEGLKLELTGGKSAGKVAHIQGAW
ncbi:hypothetical protein [Nocardioides sp.]|uniref:hypothetical protein n=1 Tax=Nocardioides sp. TaxID=35761 RepID=UPI0035B2F2B9